MAIKNSFTLLIACGALTGGVTDVVHAQALDEIVVVAQKKVESIQDVPISILRFDSVKLSDLGIDELKDVGAMMPGVYVNTFNQDPGAIRLYIRGVGNTSVQITQDPSVALYLDGVYVGTSYGTGFEGVDIESIEVLRGPQGTLYGRNSTGGAVNILSRRASPDALTFDQKFSVGNLGLFKSRTSLNVPLGEHFAAKLNYLASNRDGYVHNRGVGQDFGAEDRKSLAADLHWSISDNLSLDYRYERADMRDTQRFEQITRVNPAAALAFSTRFDRVSRSRLDSVTALRPIPRNDLNITGHSLHFSWTISDDLEFRSITARWKFDSDAYSDALSTAEGNGRFYSGSPTSMRILVNYEQFSQEFQFVGQSGRLDYVAGVYYFDSDADWNNYRQITLGNVVGLNYSNAKNTSTALYGQVTYTPSLLDERLHLTLGARYSKEDRKVRRTNLNVVPQFAGVEYDKDFSNINPSLTIAYDFTDDINIYAKVMTGFKSGGTAMTSANLTLFAQGFKEEEVLSYELGVKSMLMENSLRLNLALFRTEMDGAQTAVRTGANPNARDFLPLDDNVFQGLEIDVEKQLTDSLAISAGYAYLETSPGAKYIDSAVGRTLLANTFPASPRHSVSLMLSHEVPLANGSLRSTLNYSYQDRTTSSINVADYSVLPSYSLINMSIGWDAFKIGTMDGDFSVQLWARNLLDKEYVMVSTASWSAFGAGLVETLGDPRTYGITVGYRF